MLKYTLYIILIFFCFLLKNSYAVSPRKEFFIKEKAEVKGPKINLSNIIIGKISSKESKRLARIELGSAAKPGRKRFFSKNYIMAKIKNVDNIILEKNFFHIPKRITVLTKFKIIKKLELEKAVLKSFSTIKQNLNFSNFKINFLKNQEQIIVPDKKISLEPIIKQEKLRPGTNRIHIIIKAGRKKYKKINFRFEILIKETFLCAKEFIPKNTLIEHKHIETKEFIVKGRKRIKELLSFEHIIGKKAKYSIKKGDIIKSFSIEEPPLIVKGSTVDVILKAPNLTLKMKAKALEDGFLGKIIRLKNLRSEKIIQGVVIDQNLVQAKF